jgi:hypothetical protein
VGRGRGGSEALAPGKSLWLCWRGVVLQVEVVVVLGGCEQEIAAYGAPTIWVL